MKILPPPPSVLFVLYTQYKFPSSGLALQQYNSAVQPLAVIAQILEAALPPTFLPRRSSNYIIEITRNIRHINTDLYPNYLS